MTSLFKSLIESEALRPPGDPHGRALLEHGPHALLCLDAGGRITFENARVAELLGGEAAHRLGARLAELPGLDPYGEALVRTLLQDGCGFRDETVAFEPEAGGAERRLRMHGTPVREPGGPIAGAVLTLEDATLQHREAEGARRLRITFLGIIGHEIRTPLGAVRGYADLLGQELEEAARASGLPLPPEAAEFVDAIRDNSRRLLARVDDWCDLSKLESGALACGGGVVPLDAVIDRSLEKVRAGVEAKGLALRVERGASCALGDARRIEQVLDHLLANALKFTEWGAVSVRTLHEGARVWIEVEDTGVGMAEEYRARLFEPFSQEDRRLNRRFEGTGLGLFLVKRLVDLMRGHIEAESRLGYGSCFRFCLPAGPGSGEKDRSSTSGPPIPPSDSRLPISGS